MDALTDISNYLKKSTMHYSISLVDNQGITLEYGVSTEISNGIGPKNLGILEGMYEEHGGNVNFFLALQKGGVSFFDEDIFKGENKTKILGKDCWVNIGNRK